ncbi:MAG: hypothetical protein IKV47_03045 [Oscillospiraceae bacterium]|nr:hypothetical protein [Oscillospiraceae bacterium]
MELYLYECGSALGKKQISETAYCFLREIFAEKYRESAPEILCSKNGKPYFAGLPCHFSLSHSGRFILIGIDDEEIGVDIQLHKSFKPNSRLFSETMLAEFGYYDAWTLRESAYKLSGEGSLRDMEFVRTDDRIICPLNSINCRLYHIRDGISIAAASFGNNFPDDIIILTENTIST